MVKPDELEDDDAGMQYFVQLTIKRLLELDLLRSVLLDQIRILDGIRQHRGE
jgi:hypothetical protein